MADFRIVVIVDPSRAQRGSRQVERSLDRVGNRADRTRKLIARAFAFTGLVAGVTAAVRTLATFEQSMSTVRAITGATQAQFMALREEASRLGATTRFTASQAAEGMTFLARAGFSVDQVLASVNDTLLLAQAGALDLGAAADIASNILTGFRLRADEAGRVVDVLALAANSSNTNVQQLGEAMKFVAPVAAGLGVSLEEATAAAGALSDAGLQASLAGTGLRRVLSELESPSEKTRQLLESMGLTANDVRVSQVGLTKALTRLAKAGVDTGLALEIFGDRGGPAFEVLSSSIPKVVEMTGRLNNAEGTARRVADVMDDNLNGALLRVASAFESVILAFGDLGSTNVLTTSLDALASSLRLVSRHIDQVRQIATAASIALGVRFVASQKKAIVESLNTARANRTALAREVERTAAVRDLTRWQYEEARASARGLAGTTRAAAAHGKAAAASRAHAAAQAQLAAVTRTATVAMRGLKAAYAFVGGLPGILALAAFAIYEFVSASDDMAASADRSAESIEELRKRLEGLHEAERQLEFIRAKRQLEEFQEQLRDARADFESIVETPQRFSYATQIESLTNLVLATEKGIDLYERHIEIQRSLGIESDKTAREVERLKTSLEDLSRQKIEVDAGELARLNTQLEFYEKSSKQIETGDQGFLLRWFGPSLEEVLSRIVELRRRIGESEQTIHKVGEEAEDAARKFDELGVALDASEEFTKLRERLEKLFNPLKKISEEYE